MDPFKGQESFTSEQIADFVAKGEPEGLRKVKGVYGSAGFYQYLKGWEIRGQFLQLISKLKEVIGALDSSSSTLEAEMKKLHDELKDATEAREVAENRLSQAGQIQGITEDIREMVQEKLDAMHEMSSKIKLSITELERALELARKNYAAARQAIQDAFKDATSFLESLPKEDPSVMLEVASAWTQQQVTTLRAELKSARIAHQAVKAKMAIARAD
eukprot:UN0628